jgi:hypothetical protein
MKMVSLPQILETYIAQDLKAQQWISPLALLSLVKSERYEQAVIQAYSEKVLIITSPTSIHIEICNKPYDRQKT